MPDSRATRRLLARWTSMKVRCVPPSLQNGCRALTTPAPCVQRLPAPPASVTTATSPVCQRFQPDACGRRVGNRVRGTHRRRRRRARPRCPCRPAGGSAASPMRPLRRSARMLLVLSAVEADAGRAVRRGVARPRRRLAAARKQAIEERLHDAGSRAWCGRRRRTVAARRGAAGNELLVLRAAAPGTIRR